MSDTETLPPVAKPPAGTSAETLAAARAQYKNAGYDDATLDAAGYTAGAPLLAPNVQTVTPPGSDASVSVPRDGLTPEQRLAGYKHALQFVADKEALIAAAGRDGITAAELAYEPPSKEAVAQAQRDTEIAEGFAAPASPADYKLTYERSFAEASDTAELAALDKTVRQAFGHAGVPKVLAQPLLSAILETGGRYASEAMTDAGRELLWKEEGAIFKRVSRDPENDARLAAIGYAALPASFRDQLDTNYSLHSARSQFQLAALGRAIEYRQQRKGKG